MLTNQQAHSRKRVVILVQDGAYRHTLAETLAEELVVEAPDEMEVAIDILDNTFPDIVICDFQILNMNGVDVTKRMRHATSTSHAVFVRTTNPEEDGQVAAAGASGYPASNPPADLVRAVTSAAKAIESLSYATPARSSMACSSTLHPAVMCSGFASSISLWLIPSLHGMKIIPAGTSFAM